MSFNALSSEVIGVAILRNVRNVLENQPVGLMAIMGFGSDLVRVMIVVVLAVFFCQTP
ncbi:MAG TPA: hypothetical protein GXX30_01680 [Firmicutes bacterium]|nr:hypothetical protein [Candidatus Fermentithermobacillaceae bacterium]